MTLKLKLTTEQMGRFGVLMKTNDDSRTDEEVQEAARQHADVVAAWFGLDVEAALLGFTLREWTALVSAYDEAVAG